MDRKIATVVGATAALIAGSAAVQAAPSHVRPVPAVANYGELLEPIPDAAQRLKVAEAQDAAHRARLEKVQFAFEFGTSRDNEHHHHHHSNDWYMRNGYMWDGDQGWVTRDYYDHHHHHHHHHHNNDYYDYYDR